MTDLTNTTAKHSVSVSAKNVIDTLRKAKTLGTRLKQVQDKLAALQKDSQRALDDEDDMYSDELKNNMAAVQTKINTARNQHTAILENIHIFQSKHQQLGTLNTQLKTNPELRQNAIELRNETEEMLKFVVQQTLNLEEASESIERTLESMTPQTEKWIIPQLVDWKENLPLLYDTLFTYNLEYPAYALAWGGRLPDSAWKNGRFNFQKLYISRSPSDDEVEKGIPCTLDVLHAKLPSLRVFDEKKLISNLDPRRKAQVPYKSRIIHPGAVNRMKSFPMLPDIIVSVPIAMDSLFVWNSKTQPDRAFREDSKSNDPDVVLFGLTDLTAYGMDVHSSQPLIAATSNDGTICVWSLDDDVDHHPRYPSSRGLQARSTLKEAHRGPIEDITFHPSEPSQFCSGGGDGKMILWDLRVAGSQSKTLLEDTRTITSISWNRHSDNLILSASASGYVRLIDLRKPVQPVAVSHLHPNSPVSNVQWCPNHFNVFASTSVDDKMYICDAQLLGSGEKPSDGLPPEILFSHVGQMGEIAYFEWNIHEPLMIASVCERDQLNNYNATVQIWRPSDFLFMDQDKFVGMVRDLGSTR